jgi:hypothetical protein
MRCHLRRTLPLQSNATAARVIAGAVIGTAWRLVLVASPGPSWVVGLGAVRAESDRKSPDATPGLKVNQRSRVHESDSTMFAQSSISGNRS